MTRFLRTDASLTLAAQRAVLGLVLLPHGLQKTAGWFGGYGFDGTMGYFTGALGIPAPLALLVIAAETAGAVALVLGLGTRLAAVGAALVMTGAAVMVHAPHGFFMNWGGKAGGEGFEYHLLALALALPLVIRGAGRFSVDAWLAARLGRESAAAPHGATARAA
ncbi:MAG: DoxX family protein [Anaeromyxobacteraceae bacterium]